jgi:hypothetical protein
VITVEDWAEIRRLHRAEKLPIKEIVRRLGVARNTVRAALAADRPPRYSRPARGSLVDGVELDVRKLLKVYPRMPATVIAERIGWDHSITILKDRVRVLRPEYAGIDPADRLVHDPGAATQCDLWFPETRESGILGHRHDRRPPSGQYDCPADSERADATRPPGLAPLFTGRRPRYAASGRSVMVSVSREGTSRLDEPCLFSA